jgi:hypothetical protein
MPFVYHHSKLYLSYEETQYQRRSSVRPPHPFLAQKKGLKHGGNFRMRYSEFEDDIR